MKLASINIKKGDQVFVQSGKDKGKKGKVIRTLPREGRVVVEGINVRKKHVRPRRAGEKGDTVLIPSPLHASNVRLICPSCSKPTRLSHQVEGKSKVRVCKKCSSNVD